MNTDKVKDFIGRDLSSFKIIEMTEVYQIDEDGIKTKSIGLFKNPDVAKAFAEFKGPHYYRVDDAQVLTNGEVGFIVDIEEVKLFDDEAESSRMKEIILNKLTPSVRKILGV